MSTRQESQDYIESVQQQRCDDLVHLGQESEAHGHLPDYDEIEHSPPSGSVSEILTPSTETLKAELISTTQEPDDCDICHMPITSPCTVYPCGHAYDFDCVFGWCEYVMSYSYRRHVDNITCPKCRRSIRLIHHQFQLDRTYQILDIAKRFLNNSRQRQCFYHITDADLVSFRFAYGKYAHDLWGNGWRLGRGEAGYDIPSGILRISYTGNDSGNGTQVSINDFLALKDRIIERETARVTQEMATIIQREVDLDDERISLDSTIQALGNRLAAVKLNATNSILSLTNAWNSKLVAEILQAKLTFIDLLRRWVSFAMAKDCRLAQLDWAEDENRLLEILEEAPTFLSRGNRETWEYLQRFRHIYPVMLRTNVFIDEMSSPLRTNIFPELAGDSFAILSYPPWARTFANLDDFLANALPGEQWDVPMEFHLDAIRDKVRNCSEVVIIDYTNREFGSKMVMLETRRVKNSDRVSVRQGQFEVAVPAADISNLLPPEITIDSLILILEGLRLDLAELPEVKMLPSLVLFWEHDTEKILQYALDVLEQIVQQEQSVVRAVLRGDNAVAAEHEIFEPRNTGTGKSTDGLAAFLPRVDSRRSILGTIRDAWDRLENFASACEADSDR